MKSEKIAEKDIEKIADSELLTRISQKDYEALDEFWNRYDKIVLSLFQKLLKEEYFPVHAHQRLFTIIWGESSNYRGGDVRSYLCGIVQNVYKEVIRGNTKELPSSHFPEYKQEDIIAEFDKCRDNYLAYKRELSSKKIRDRIKEAINSLPENKKMIITLKIESDMTWGGISEKMKIPEKICRITYIRALKELRYALREYEGDYTTTPHTQKTLVI